MVNGKISGADRRKKSRELGLATTVLVSTMGSMIYPMPDADLTTFHLLFKMWNDSVYKL